MGNPLEDASTLAVIVIAFAVLSNIASVYSTFISRRRVRDTRKIEQVRLFNDFRRRFGSHDMTDALEALYI